jgi:hypothetical protein
MDDGRIPFKLLYDGHKGLGAPPGTGTSNRDKAQAPGHICNELTVPAPADHDNGVKISEPGDIGKGGEKALVPQGHNDPSVFLETLPGRPFALDFQSQKGKVEAKKNMTDREESKLYEVF